MSNTIQSKTLATTPLGTSDILAIVQGGALKRTTVGDLPDDATVITNANGTAVRWGSGFQVCAKHDFSFSGLIGATTAVQEWTFPATFESASKLLFASAMMDNIGFSSAGDRASLVTYQSADSGSVQFIPRLGSGATWGGDTVTGVRVFAVGLWK